MVGKGYAFWWYVHKTFPCKWSPFLLAYLEGSIKKVLYCSSAIAASISVSICFSVFSCS